MPLRQPLGTDATVVLKFGYKQALAELGQTTNLARSTDFDNADPSTTSGIVETLMAMRA